MDRRLLALLLLALLTLPGCLDAFRVRVGGTALDESPLPWEVNHFDQEGDSFGLRVKESRYVHQPDDERDPPFPGVLQVFSMRGGDSQDQDALMERARTVVADALDKESIQVDASKDAQGERTLRSGVGTRWFLHEGSIQSGGGSFFSPESRITVRVLAEVGVDGKSDTGFIVVAFVKVAQQESGPLSGVPGTTDRTVQDLTTWIDVVADPDGSVLGASFSDRDRGLIYNLVTHD